MSTDTARFYDDLAEHYHLIFENWGRSIERQAGALGPLLENKLARGPLKILDCACGIGTQAIGIAQRGHTVVATDLSSAAIRRAAREARKLGLDIKFHVADMRDLSALPKSEFDAVLVGDNSLPHLLSDEDLSQALENISIRLKPGGVLLATIRDYDSLLSTRPSFQGPTFYSENETRRIVHQVWDWDGNQYEVHLYLTWNSVSLWTSKHYASRYRAITRAELTQGLESHGFKEIEWLMPEATTFYQPIVLARKEDNSAVESA
ncbi:class I SAM-dependent methyltransferase [Granulicella sp. WH15]|uniref:class I SAM-dependent methyltransferase n=1 Tax=Granulicella sp. WH15 TaxID=2602070 RepID=UPI0013672AF4|nr:class I SAM-dependent methyltransferase [Granulicella sp. WH15]QHN02783.1 class I SAM-dependent methyltransferase [Granulicella sp. WH15]